MEHLLTACFMSGTAVVSGELEVNTIWLLSSRNLQSLHDMVKVVKCYRNIRGFF